MASLPAEDDTAGLDTAAAATTPRRAAGAAAATDTRAGRGWGRAPGAGGEERTRLAPEIAADIAVNRRGAEAAAAEEEEERPECAICLAEFARGDEVRVLPPCGHGFHAACVDVWLVSTSTCPSCRRAIVVLAAPSPAVTAAATDPPPPCCAADAAQASSQPPQPTGASDRGGCRTSVP